MIRLVDVDVDVDGVEELRVLGVIRIRASQTPSIWSPLHYPHRRKRMIDPSLAKGLVTVLSFGALGSVVGVAVRIWDRDESGPDIGQSAAIGFQLGSAWGAFHAIFQSLVS